MQARRTSTLGTGFQKVKSQTSHPALTDTYRGRTQVGVGEEVSVYLDPPLGMTFPESPIWFVSGGGIDATDGSATTYTAASNACSATVTVQVRDVKLAKTFGVLEPSGVDAKITDTSGFLASGQAGAWMHLNVTLKPTNVSFYRLQMEEIGKDTTDITDYFTDPAHPPLSHAGHGADEWHPVDENNLIGDGMDECKYAGTFGTAFFSNFPLPRNVATGDWSPGGEFTWPITTFWRIGINLGVLPWSDQHFKLDSSGTMTITKFGESVTRDINNNRNPSLP